MVVGLQPCSLFLFMRVFFDKTGIHFCVTVTKKLLLPKEYDNSLACFAFKWLCLQTNKR